MMVTRWVTVCGAVLVMGGTVSGCGHSASPPTLEVATGWDAKGYIYAKVGQVHTYGAINACIEKGSGPVTIVDVKPTKSSGIVFTGWGSRPNPFLVGGNQNGGLTKPLSQDGFATGPADLDSTLCGADKPVTREIAIEFHRNVANQTGWIDGLTASFTVGHSKKVHHSLWTLAFALCGGTSPPGPDFGAVCKS